MAALGGKKLTQLRVVDLRAELERRGLEKSGLKGVLVERLEKSLLDESSEFNESAELDSTVDSEALDEEAGTPNGDESNPSNEYGVIPDDFSSFIVLDSGDDSDHEDSIKKDDDDDCCNVSEKMDVAEEKGKGNEEVKDEANVEKILLIDDDQELEEEEGSLEFEYDASETLEEDKEDKEQDEAAADDEEEEEEMKNEETKKEETKKEETKKEEPKKEETKKEETKKEEPKKEETKKEETKKEETKKEETKKEETKKEETKKEETVAPLTLPKPNENQLSLSLCVNTDDVQDDLDEDLKEIEKTKTVSSEGEENADEVSPDMETEENTVEDDSAKIEVKTDVEVDEEKVTEGDEAKGEEGAENDEVEDKETGVEVEEVKTVAVKTESKEKEIEEDEKDVVKKEDKKEVKEKAPKKEEPAKKVAKKEEKKADKKVEVKEEKKSTAEAKKKEAGKSLWVSNLSSMTRAADLKTRFTQYGKVVGAKIVTNSKTPGAQCFGLVTMSTSEEAAKCIQHLHRTEMHGRSITVDRAKGDRIPTAPPSAKKAAEKRDAKSAAAKEKDDKAKDDKAKDDKEKEKEKSTEKKPSDKEKGDKPLDKTAASKTVLKTTVKTGKESDAKVEKGKSDNASKTSHRSASSDKKESKDPKKSTSSSHRSSPKGGDEAKPGKNLKSLDDVRRERRERQIRERRERERRDRVRRERERVARERAMERERERLRQRERERRRLHILREKEERERQERLRLERERQRQRELERQRERERQERERERLLQERRQREDRERLERERERLERERLQRLERERLERQRVDDRRGVKRPAEAYVREPTRGPGYWQDTKRPAPERAADSRDFFGGLSGRERAAREVLETRPGPPRERRTDPRASHSAPKRDDPPRDDHRRVDREHGNVSRSGRDPPRERDSRDRRASWETSGAMQTASDPQKGLSLLLQRAGVSGILGDFSGRSGGVSLPKPLAPSGVSSSLSRGKPAATWNGRANAHPRPMVSSQSLSQSAPANPSARVGRPPVMSDSGRSNWPTSADKDRERVRERDRGVATREMARSSWSGSANPVNLMASHAVSHDRTRQVIAASRAAVPPRMVSQHSAGQPMGVTASSMMDSRRAVAMSGRSDAFRSGVAGMPRNTTMRRY